MSKESTSTLTHLPTGRIQFERTLHQLGYLLNMQTHGPHVDQWN